LLWEAYNLAVAAVLLNRIVILLSCVGIFIAGVLSMGHIMHVSIPCGLASGCDQVAHHPSSFWFGVPVAYFGAAMYITLLVLATWRLFATERYARKLLLAGFGISAIAALVSLGFAGLFRYGH
jgi:uncharacterized membrane protein